MTAIGRQTVCVVMFLSIAGGAIPSATRFAASATGAGTSIGAVADDASPRQANSTQPDAAAQAVPPNQKTRSASDPADARRWPISRAARRADGTYQGFVLPGPGAVLVKTRQGSGYRPAHVDPKVFFAPGRTDWTAQERISAYGTQDTLSTYDSWTDQHDYAAIVLINPAMDSGPLELSATVAKDKPRRVSLVDHDGKPVVGAETQGMTFHPWDAEPPLRAATFPLTRLHPDRARRITFIKSDRQLIGFLLARGDDEALYTVRMRPWGTVTGRIVDESGKALPIGKRGRNWESPPTLSMVNEGIVTNADPEVGVHDSVATDAEGRFRIDRLVPGQRYSAQIYRGTGDLAGTAFKNLVVRPGEVRKLGDIRTKSPFIAQIRSKTGH
jgi:hypothetical protein